MLILATLITATLASADADFGDARRFGSVISDDALVRVSSTSSWDEPERHLALVGAGHAPFAFHTADEERPWVWVDLGAAHQVTGLVVDNRADDNGARTRGLAVAISLNGKDWIDVATLDGPKPQWTVPLLDADAPRTARYVRVQLTSKGMLHLSRVRVWGDPVKGGG